MIEKYLADAGAQGDDDRDTCRCRRSAASCRRLRGYELHPAFDVKASTARRPAGAGPRRAVGSRQRPRAGDGRRAGAGPRRARRGRRRAAESRADPEGPGAAERHHRACEDRSDACASAPAARRRSIGCAARSRFSGPRVGRGRLPGARRRASPAPSTAAHHARRPAPRPTAAPRPRKGFIVTAGAGAAAGVRPARQGRQRRPARPAGANRRAEARDRPVGRRLPRRRATGADASTRHRRRSEPVDGRRARRSATARRPSSRPAPPASPTRARGTVADLNLPRIGQRDQDCGARQAGVRRPHQRRLRRQADRCRAPPAAPSAIARPRAMTLDATRHAARLDDHGRPPAAARATTRTSPTAR